MQLRVRETVMDHGPARCKMEQVEGFANALRANWHGHPRDCVSMARPGPAVAWSAWPRRRLGQKIDSGLAGTAQSATLAAFTEQ